MKGKIGCRPYISIIWGLSGQRRHGKIMDVPERGPVRVSSHYMVRFQMLTGGDEVYYVKSGRTTYFCARGPRFTKLPEDIKTFDYDNAKKWPDSALQFEKKRVADDPLALTALFGEFDRRKGAEAQPPWFDDKYEMLADLELAVDEENDEYEDEGDSFVIYEDLPSEIQEMIRKLAEVERKDLDLSRQHLGQRLDDLSPKEMDVLMKQKAVGEKARAALMHSELAEDIPVLDPDGVDDKKDMAAKLFFMYSLNRVSAEVNGEKPNEDLFYAAANMYGDAVAEEMSRYNDDDEDWDEEDEDDENPLELMARLFSEHIQNAEADDEFVQDLGEITDHFLTEKGFNLSTLSGLKAAQKWLEEAKVEDAFWTEGPIDNAIDWHIGEARIAAMLKVVKKRIEDYIKRK